MIDSARWIVPPEELIQEGEHIREAIRLGQKRETEVYIFRQGNWQNNLEIAGAISFGYGNPEYYCSAFGPRDSDYQEDEPDTAQTEDKEQMIQRELDKLMNSYESHMSRHMTPPETQNDESKNHANDSVNNKNDNVEEINFCVDNIYIVTDRHDDKKDYGLRTGTRTKASDSYIFKGTVCSETEQRAYDQIRYRAGDGNASGGLAFVMLDGLSETMERKIIFELNGKVVNVSKPTMNYYTRALEYYLSKSGWKLSDDTESESVVHILKRFRGNEFSIKDFEAAIHQAIKKAKRDMRQCLSLEDFNYFDKDYKQANTELNQMIGLERIKDKIRGVAALAAYEYKRSGINYKPKRNNICFAGSPGSGKTEMAKLYGMLLEEHGVTGGSFIAASKSDYVGMYVGHTAHKMRSLFERARDGVIFFDECSALLTEDSFAQEAMTELVRFMELYQDVVCIFAGYDKDINMLLERDAGLRSRISEVIHFEDYSGEELYQIFELFCHKEEFRLEECEEIIIQAVADEKREKPDSFGNGRYVRNVFDKAKEQLALEVMEKGLNPSEENLIRREHVSMAVKLLHDNQIDTNASRRIGFCLDAREVAVSEKA